MDSTRRAFHDIAVGYTRGIIFSRPTYIKHLSYADQIDYDIKKEFFFNEAKKSGIETNDEKLEILKKRGLWTDEMEREVTNSKLMVESLYEGKKSNMKWPSLVKKYTENIKEEEKKYSEKVAKKFGLMGLTCESYAERELNDHYIYTNLYKDEKMTIPLFSLDEFDYLEDQEVSKICSDYNVALEPCSIEGIKKLSIQSFFQEYYGLSSDNPMSFFGKPICTLTFFQVKLLNYGAHYRSIYQNHDVSKFPKEARENPDMLTDYAIAASKGKEELQKQGAYDQDAINVGISKEDSKVLGVKSQNNLAAEIAKSGGSVIDWAMKRAT